MIRRVAIARFVSPLQHLHPLAPEDFEDGDAEVDAEIYYAAEMNGDHYDLQHVAICLVFASFASNSCCQR